MKKAIMSAKQSTNWSVISIMRDMLRLGCEPCDERSDASSDMRFDCGVKGVCGGLVLAMEKRDCALR